MIAGGGVRGEREQGTEEEVGSNVGSSRKVDLILSTELIM